MISTSTYGFIFVAACFLSIAVLRILNKKADPLRKAWNVYGAMYFLHFILFAGLYITLPATSPSFRSGSEPIPIVKTVDGLSEELVRQREEIEQLKDHIHSTTQTVLFGAYMLALFAPMLYYNLFKYNLEIEKLSGKRMGSFD